MRQIRQHCGIFFFLFISLIYARTSNAESVPEFIGKDLASPVTTKARYVLLAGSIATGTLLAFQHGLVYHTQEEVVESKPLDKYSIYGDQAGQWIPNAIYMAGMLVHGAVFWNSKSLQRASIMFRATLYSSGVTVGLKQIIREPRPDNAQDYHSFPSGHTTTAFAFASVVGAEHDWYFGVPAYALALFTGFSRINDNRHYLHDVVAGMTIGMSYGLGIYFRSNGHRRVADQENDPGVSFAFQILPTERMDGSVFVLHKAF